MGRRKKRGGGVKKTKKIPVIPCGVALIRRERQFLISQRNVDDTFGSFWEFPGGKIEKGETPQEALKRGLKEELDIDVAPSRHLMNIRHFYTQFRVKLHVFHCQSKSYPRTHIHRKWLPVNELTEYPMPSGSAKIVVRLQKSH